MKKGIRHGEVALIPTDAKVKGKTVKNYIVAHSETGHNHVLESASKIVVDEKDFLIELFGDTALVHKKSFDAHKTLPLEKGVYKRYEAVEYDPFAAVTRRVVD